MAATASSIPSTVRSVRIIAASNGNRLGISPHFPPTALDAIRASGSVEHPNWWEPGALKPIATPVAGLSDHVFFRILLDELSGREAKETRRKGLQLLGGQYATTTRTARLFHHGCNVVDNTIDLLLRGFKHRHSRMTRINGSNERLFKSVDRKSLRKVSERRRLGVRALTDETDGVATRTVLCHERLPASDDIVRLRCASNVNGAHYCKTE